MGIPASDRDGEQQAAAGQRARSAYRRADAAGREALVERYLPLVKHIASRMSMGLPSHVDTDDLYSYGIFGLLDALERFEPERGVKFETYAFARIKGAILDGLRAMDWVPASVRQKARILEDAYASLESKLGRSAQDEEVAAELGMTMEKFLRAVAAVEKTSVLSLDELWSDEQGEEFGLGDMLSDDGSANPSTYAEWRNREEILSAAIDTLPDRERLVVALFYYEGLAPKEIAAVMHLSVSRISQLHTRAVLRLRGRIDAAQRSLL